MLALASLAALTGCAAPRGDFDRPKPSYLNDKAMPMLGRERAAGRGEPVSYYMLTDDEKELRRRSYRLVMPIHRDSALKRNEAELVRTRIWPDSSYRPDPTLYYRELVADRYKSNVGRWNAVEGEIVADMALIGPFQTVAERVCAADARRLADLSRTVALTAAEEADAVGRVYENRRVMDWAVTALRWRVESYAYAIQRQRIEIPTDIHVASDIALRRFMARVDGFAAAMAALHCEAGAAGLARGLHGHGGAWPGAGVIKR